MRLPLTFALRVKPGSASRTTTTTNTKTSYFAKNCFGTSTPTPTPKYYLLSYTYNPDNLVERRAPHRPAHLSLAKEYATAGKLLLGGAFANPIDGAALVFHGTEKDVIDFVKRDPYVINGIVTKHSVREWTVLAGADAK